MKGIGLVFAGGGGKGAYEIGVWKYLDEIGLDQYVRSVSGTSVGALNAALFVGSSYEIAEDLWLNIEPKKILSPKEIKPEDVVKFLAAAGISLAGPMGRISSLVLSETAMGAETIVQLLLTRIRSDYMFSRSGLIELIHDGINFPLLQNSDVLCFATCLRCSSLKVERFKLNELDTDGIIKVLLASSAIPVVFLNEEFKGHKYCDGGVPIVGDNIPIAPIYETGVEHIFVVHLSRESIIDKDKYPNSTIIEIVPSIDLGNALTGTLDFTPDGSAKRIEQGYADAKRTLQPMVDMLKLNAESQMILKAAQKKMGEFKVKKAKLMGTGNEIKAEMQKDGFNDLFNELMKEK